MSRLTDPWSTPSADPSYAVDSNIYSAAHEGSHDGIEGPPEGRGWGDHQELATETRPDAAELESKAQRVEVSLDEGLSGQWVRKYHTYIVTVRFALHA